MFKIPPTIENKLHEFAAIIWHYFESFLARWKGQLHRSLKYEDRRVFECSYGIEVRLCEQ